MKVEWDINYLSFVCSRRDVWLSVLLITPIHLNKFTSPRVCLRISRVTELNVYSTSQNSTAKRKRREFNLNSSEKKSWGVSGECICQVYKRLKVSQWTPQRLVVLLFCSYNGLWMISCFVGLVHFGETALQNVGFSFDYQRPRVR